MERVTPPLARGGAGGNHRFPYTINCIGVIRDAEVSLIIPMERVTGIEPVSSAWEALIITTIRYPPTSRFAGLRRAGPPVSLKTSAGRPASSAKVECFYYALHPTLFELWVTSRATASAARQSRLRSRRARPAFLPKVLIFYSVKVCADTV